MQLSMFYRQVIPKPENLFPFEKIPISETFYDFLQKYSDFGNFDKF